MGSETVAFVGWFTLVTFDRNNATRDALKKPFCFRAAFVG